MSQGLRHVITGHYKEDIHDVEDYFSEIFIGPHAIHFSAREMCRAAYPEKAGGAFLIPPTRWWPRLAALAYLAELGRVTGDPVNVAHVYRPEPYNRLVGSKSDNHVECCAIDLDYTSLYSHTKALEAYRAIAKSPVHLNIGIGVGARRIHVDIFSPNGDKAGGPRSWEY